MKLNEIFFSLLSSEYMSQYSIKIKKHEIELLYIEICNLLINSVGTMMPTSTHESNLHFSLALSIKTINNVGFHLWVVIPMHFSAVQ